MERIGSELPGVTRHLVHRSLSPIVKATRQLRADILLSRILKGKRVLVLGSGPSAVDLAHVPDDVIVCACNLSPRLLANTGRTHIALYSCPSRIMLDHTYRVMVEEALAAYTVGTILTWNPAFVRDALTLKQRPRHILYNRAKDKDGYYLRRIIGVEKTRAALALGTSHKTSAAVGPRASCRVRFMGRTDGSSRRTVS